MIRKKKQTWKKKVVQPGDILGKIEPGMTVFLSTGLGEPRTLVSHLMEWSQANLQDVELVQIVSFGEAISFKGLDSQRLRLKTFFSGWVASEAVTEGRVDLIPSRFSQIPGLIESGQIPIDVAFVQVTPPNEAGYCSLGVAVDVARQAMEKASLVVGEITKGVPVTFGDTFVPESEFDFFILSTREPTYFSRWPAHEVFDLIAANLSSLIGDGSCIAFSIGPVYEALGRQLVHKRHLGVHSPFFTDPLMDLVKAGAVTNRRKENWRGKSVASYAFGTRDLMTWLDRNPLVEFQPIDKVFDPNQIGHNPRFMAVLPARKVDLTGRIALHFGKGNISAGPGEALDFIIGAQLSPGGKTFFALPSRNLKGESNILISIKEFPNQLGHRESVDVVVTEYGSAHLRGRTLRERAQALIDIAHPDVRPELVEKAKAEKLLYEDQIFLAECALLYPSDISATETFKGGLKVHFRAIKPSDEEEMRRLFYRFSDQAVYYRYFSPVKTMPHSRMQEYVNVDCNKAISIVGEIIEPGPGRIIAEARYVRNEGQPTADVAFLVDEDYQGLGIGTHLYKMLILAAKERGINGFTANVLASNKAMMKVFEKGALPVKARLEQGIYELSIPFDD